LLFISAIRRLNLELIKKHSDLLKRERRSRETTSSETSLTVSLTDHCANFDPR
ncbi:hypothetical protein PSTT_06795, partial [Puccinia striiformis]